MSEDEKSNVVPFRAPGRAPDPEDFLAEVLDGWGTQQFVKGFSPKVIKNRRTLVLRLVDFSGHYPWDWTLGDADEFFGHLRGVVGSAFGTVRKYQGDIKLFCDFACSPAYEWSARAIKDFGRPFGQVVTELNRVTHSQVHETRSEKRPFTRQELEAFFALADRQVERMQERGRHRDALTAWRDAVAFKVAYGWGLRVDELRHLQLVDLSRNGRAPYFGNFGIVRVRYGKAHRGAAKKQRSVLSVWQWSVDVLEEWTEFALPLFGYPMNDLFPTTTGGLVSESHLIGKLRRFTDELGFPPGLDIHSLRRSYATHLIEDAWDTAFVQLQMGHEHPATTSVYTMPAADYQRRVLESAHNRTLDAALKLPNRKDNS